MKPKPIQLSTSSCETVYQVGDHKLLLWVITGGEPALSFMDYYFSTRYPIKDERWVGMDFSKEGYPETGKWDNKAGCFIHQDPTNPQGPTFDVLPNGVDTLYEYLDKNLPIKILRDSRLASFPTTLIRNKKRLHNKEDHSYFYLHVDVCRGVVSRVRYEAMTDYGRSGYLSHNKVVDFSCIPQAWKDYDELITSFGDVSRIENLTEEQFQAMLKAYSNLT